MCFSYLLLEFDTLLIYHTLLEIIFLDLSCLDHLFDTILRKFDAVVLNRFQTFHNCVGIGLNTNRKNIGRLPLLIIKHFILSLDFQYLENS